MKKWTAIYYATEIRREGAYRACQRNGERQLQIKTLGSSRRTESAVLEEIFNRVHMHLAGSRFNLGERVRVGIPAKQHNRCWSRCWNTCKGADLFIPEE